ncbi:MAG: PD-(D/E)XK nuclease family protein, partial [Bryobacteraceae bacterium]
AMDRLENEALARGWTEEQWTSPFPNMDGETADNARLRKQWTTPFLRLRAVVTNGGALRPTGEQLTEAIRGLWRDLDVGEQLAKLEQDAAPHRFNPQLHSTVWQQANSLLDDVARAFAGESLSMAVWLAILEAGLSGLTVGVIPPALDQVLIGTVDRSRNPDLRLALLLGVNETVFPAPPPARTLLTEPDCAELRGCDVNIGPGIRRILAREQYLGYIACTRPRETLLLTFAQHDDGGTALNPSPFLSHIKRLFPQLAVEKFTGPGDAAPEHVCEWVPRLLRVGGGESWCGLADMPAFAPLRDRLKLFARPELPGRITALLAEALYGRELRTSVSRLEQFAGCAFRFFVNSGLQAGERRLFELDARQRGSFQHEALARFHFELERDAKRWHDLTPVGARQRMADVCTALVPEFGHGVLAASAAARFAARTMSRSLGDFVAAMTEWMRQYEFEPAVVEIDFGGGPEGLP